MGRHARSCRCGPGDQDPWATLEGAALKPTRYPASTLKGIAHEALAWMHGEIQEPFGIVSFWATTVPENRRCQALLQRSNYTQVHAGVPLLYSFEKRDLVFHLRGAA